MGGAVGILSALAVSVPLWYGTSLAVPLFARLAHEVAMFGALKALMFTACLLVIVAAVWLANAAETNINEPARTDHLRSQELGAKTASLNIDKEER